MANFRRDNPWVVFDTLDNPGVIPTQEIGIKKV